VDRAEHQVAGLGRVQARLERLPVAHLEIDRPDGPMWKWKEFAEFVAELPREEPYADRLLAHARQLHGSELLADDFSFLEVRF
jgi:hypothetical protein